MSDLNAAIREHLALLDYDGQKAAILAANERHPLLARFVANAVKTGNALRAIAAMHVPCGTTGNYGHVICSGCANDGPHSECPELLAIAKELGIEAPSDQPATKPTPVGLRARLEELWGTQDGMIEILGTPELLAAVASEAARADGTMRAFVDAYLRLCGRRTKQTEADDGFIMLERSGGGVIRRDGDQITVTPSAEVGDAR